MSSRLLIWGYGRVGSAIIQGCLRNWNAFEDSTRGFDQLVVVSTKARNASLPEDVLWLNSDEVLSNPNSYLHPGDVLLLTVSDAQIQAIAKPCDFPGLALVHCSGATPKIQTESAESMVFYPLQTFAVNTQMDWKQIPVFIESNDDHSRSVLQSLAALLGVVQLHTIPFAERENLHMAAVFANNFTTAMAGIAHDIVIERGLDSAWIQPILTQTAQNLGANNPWDKLTGPAKRGDESTQKKHLSLLSANPQLQALYTIMSGYIQHRSKNDKDAPSMP